MSYTHNVHVHSQNEADMKGRKGSVLISFFFLPGGLRYIYRLLHEQKVYEGRKKKKKKKMTKRGFGGS